MLGLPGIGTPPEPELHPVGGMGLSSVLQGSSREEALIIQQLLHLRCVALETRCPSGRQEASEPCLLTFACPQTLVTPFQTYDTTLCTDLHQGGKPTQLEGLGITLEQVRGNSGIPFSSFSP